MLDAISPNSTKIDGFVQEWNAAADGNHPELETNLVTFVNREQFGTDVEVVIAQETTYNGQQTDLAFVGLSKSDAEKLVIALQAAIAAA